MRNVTVLRAAKRARPAPEPEQDPEDREREDEDEDDTPDVAPPQKATEFERQIEGRLPKKRSGMAFGAPQISFLLMVALPVCIVATYLFFFASPQYVSTFKFSVRSQEQAASTLNGPAAAAAGSSASSPMMFMSTNFIIMDYLKSRDALEELSKQVDFEKMYKRSDADWWARMPADASIEQIANFWQKTISTGFDMSTGIATVQVRSFTPEDSFEIARALVSISERLVNDTQNKSRTDAIAFFEQEVSRAELRLRMTRLQVRNFRNAEQLASPAQTAASILTNIAGLEQDLATQRKDLQTLMTFVDKSSPKVTVMQARLKATEEQIARLRAQIGSNQGSDKALISGQLATFDELQQNLQFAEKLYQASVSSLETARANAAMQHTYLATFVQPKAAQTSTYPLKLPTIFLVFLATGFVWFVTLMAAYAVRDHAI